MRKSEFNNYSGINNNSQSSNEDKLSRNNLTNQEIAPGIRAVRVNMQAKENYIPDSKSRDIDLDAENTRELSAAEDIYVTNDSRSVILEILDWLKYIIIAVIIGLLLSRYVIQRSSVSGRSMLPTLENSDQLIIDKLSLNFSDIRHGEIVTLDVSNFDNHILGEDKLLVKRIIALPGDKLDFKEGKVILNGKILDETYLSTDTFTNEPANWKGEITIAKNHYYVLGDNRGNSSDSRVFGPVPLNSIKGRVWVRIYPFNKFGKVN